MLPLKLYIHQNLFFQQIFLLMISNTLLQKMGANNKRGQLFCGCRPVISYSNRSFLRSHFNCRNKLPQKTEIGKAQFQKALNKMFSVETNCTNINISVIGF